MWNDVIEENGLSVVALDSQHVRVQRGEQWAAFRLVGFDRRVHPRDIGAPPEPNSLLVAAALSPAAAETARQRGWSVVTYDGPSWIKLGGHIIELIRTAENPADQAPPTARRGRPGYGVFSVLRMLLSLEGGGTQAEMAEFAGISQGRISQALHQLRELHLAERTDQGWSAPDHALAVSWWVAHYPGPGGLRTRWYGLDPVVRQAHRAHELLAAHGARPAVSGDVAADLVAPWRVPRHALLYAERGADLAEIGLTPADPANATLTLVVPADPAVWPIGRTPHLIEVDGIGEMARAGALQVLWDLLGSPGPDAQEAAEGWRNWMLADAAII